MSDELSIIGRQSSHFTRMVRMVAEELGLSYVSHLPFRNPVDLSGMPRLTAFEQRFGERPSALATPYRFDQPPT